MYKKMYKVKMIDDAMVYYDTVIKRERSWPGNCFRDFLEVINARKL